MSTPQAAASSVVNGGVIGSAAPYAAGGVQAVAGAMAPITIPSDRVLRADWVLKRSRFSAYRKYERRYLVLSRSRLRYFHSEQHFAEEYSKPTVCSEKLREDDQNSAEVGCSIPLSVISDISISSARSSFTKFFKLNIDISSQDFSTRLVFKCDAKEAQAWRDAIARAREAFLSSRASGSSNSNNSNTSQREFAPLVLRRNARWRRAIAAVATRRFRSTNAAAGTFSEGSSSSSCCSSILTEQEIKYLTKLGQLMLGSDSVVIEVAKAIFDALSRLSSSRASGDAVEWSKKLGHCAAALLRPDASPPYSAINTTNTTTSAPGFVTSPTGDPFASSPHHYPYHHSTNTATGPQLDGGFSGGGFGHSQQHSGEHMLVHHFLRISLLRELEAANKAKTGGSASDGDERSKCRLNQMPFRGNNPESVFIGNFVKCVARETGLLSEWLLDPLLKVASSPEILEASIAKLDNYVMSTSPSAMVVALEGSGEGGTVVANSTTSSSTTSTANASGECEERDAAAAKQSALNAVIDAATENIIDSIAAHAIDAPMPLRMLITEIFRITAPALKRSDSFIDGSSSIPRRFAVDIFSDFGSDDERNYCQACCGLLILRVVCPAILSPLEWGVLRRRRRPSLRPPSASSFSVSQQAETPLVSAATQAPMKLSDPSELSHHIKDLLSNNEASLESFSLTASASIDEKDVIENPSNTRTQSDMDVSSQSHDGTVTTEGECIVVDECDGDRNDMHEDEPEVIVDLSRNTAFLVLLSHILTSAPDVMHALEDRLLATAIPESMTASSRETSHERSMSGSFGDRAGSRSDSTDPGRKSFLKSMMWKLVSSGSFVGEPGPSSPVSSSPTSSSAYLQETTGDIKSWAISLSELMLGICNMLPLTKVDEILGIDLQATSSLVDTSTERAFQSIELRRCLVGLAKGVQRAANASCIPEAELLTGEFPLPNSDGSSPRQYSPRRAKAQGGEGQERESSEQLSSTAVAGADGADVGRQSERVSPANMAALRIPFVLKEVYQNLVQLDPEIDNE